MNPAIQGYTAAVLDTLDGDGSSVLESDLAAVDRLFSRDAELSAVLTDIAIPPAARRAVLADLLEGKVSPAAQRVAAYAAGAVPSQEVPAAISWIAHRLRQVVGRRETTEEVLGHREARERVGGYAAEVFEDATVPELEEIEDQLFRFARIVADTPALRTVLGDRDLPSEVRRGVADELLSGKVLPATLRLAGYAVSGGRPRDIVGTLDWLVEQTAAARGWRVARVRAGQEVDRDERTKLEGTLTRLTGSPVELQVTVDPVLLAGVEVEIGDLRLDATARGRLDRLREHMTAGGWQDVGFGRAQRAAATGRSSGERPHEAGTIEDE